MRIKILLAASTALALVAAAPGANAGDLYVSVFGGANFLADDSGPWETSDGTWHSDADTGFALGGAVGTHLDKWAQGLRVELEASYRRNDVNGAWFESSNSESEDFAGNVSTFAIMANAWYDFDVGSKAVPYVGGGAGWARLRADMVQQGDDTPATSNDQSGFAWQLGAGFHYAVAPDVSLGLGYRYFHGPNMDFDLEDEDGTLHNDNHVVQIDLTIGIN